MNDSKIVLSFKSLSIELIVAIVYPLHSLSQRNISTLQSIMQSFSNLIEIVLTINNLPLSLEAHIAH